MDCTGFCISLGLPDCWIFHVSVMNVVTHHLELPEDLGRAGRCCLSMMRLDSRIGSVMSSWHPSAEPGTYLRTRGTCRSVPLLWPG